ncbi:hypothetical protein [Solitalea lacus]|uniref:hypothetical protein n=1 Tax=Solitalea lacus TaxID=2911172 RepID=UPI001EDC1F73|nr:hypothetical protein [Solitalea lacus]UKJ09221.1 hypothetical protein L2B55_08700 [Solitalea lacus]
MDELEEVISERGESILEMAGKNASEAELIAQLKAKLVSHEGLHLPACQVVIINFLNRESRNYAEWC